MREIWLKNAQHDRAHEGECDVGGQDAHVASESHATSRHLFAITQRPCNRFQSRHSSSMVQRNGMVKND